MAVSVASYNSSNFANDLTNTPNLTGVTADTGDVILVAYMFRGNEGADITSVSRNSESFTERQDLAIATDALRMQFFQLVVTSELDAHDILATNAAFKATAAGYAVFSGVDSTTPLGTIQTEVKFDVSWAAPSLNVADAAVDDLAFEILGTTDWDGGFTSTGATWSPANSQTELFETSSTGHVSQPGLIMAYKAGTGSSQTLGYTPSAGQPGFIHIAFAVKAAGGAPTAPEFTAGPSVSSVTSGEFTAGGTANVNCTARLVVTNAGASQPADGTFDASSETESVTAATPFTIPHTGESGGQLRWAWVQLDNGTTRATDYAPALVPHAGFDTVVVGTPNTTADNRITAVADIASGDTISWGNIQGTGTVVVNDDATFDADETVTAFDVYVGDLTDGWGTVGTQTISTGSASCGPFESRIFAGGIFG